MRGSLLQSGGGLCKKEKKIEEKKVTNSLNEEVVASANLLLFSQLESVMPEKLAAVY